MDRNKDTEVLASVLLLIASPFLIGALIIWSVFWSALAGWQLWQWFAIPLGAPNLNGYHIAGLLMIAHLGLRNAPKPEREGESKTLQLIAALVESPIIAIFSLIAGWIVAKSAGLI